MKYNHISKISSFIGLLFMALSFTSYAGSSLNELCNNGLTFTPGVRVTSLMVESKDNGFDVKFTNSANYYWMEFDKDSTRRALFDMLKASFITQAPINTCVNNDGLFFIGAEMKVS